MEQFLSKGMAVYVKNISYGTLDERVKRYAVSLIRDAVGCMIAGADEESVQIARKYTDSFGYLGDAHIIGQKEKIEASLAALVNGVAINAHDFDDVCLTMNGHPSAVVLSAALAAAEKYCADGKKLLESYIAGVEVIACLGRGVCPSSFERGWHCTSVLGIFGAVAAVGKLADLTEEKLAHAFAIAASEASGIKSNLGSLMKPFHCGRAAQKAFEIIKLAELGCTANPDALEGRAGLCNLITDTFQANLIWEALKTKQSCFLLPGVAIKPYPSCKHTLNGIGAVLELLDKSHLQADLIERIECYVADRQYGEFTNETESSGMRKLNLRYCIATAVIDGEVTPGSFEGPVRMEVKDMLSRVVLYGNPELSQEPEDTTKIVIYTYDGRILSMKMTDEKGSLKNPMTEREQKQKFCSCSEKHIKNPDELWSVLGNIEQLTDCGACIPAFDYS